MDQAAGDGGHIGVEVDRRLVRPGRHAEPATDIDLAERLTVGEESASDGGDRRERLFEAGQPSGEPA